MDPPPTPLPKVKSDIEATSVVAPSTEVAATLPLGCGWAKKADVTSNPKPKKELMLT
jgi:hypothetical protein